MSKELFFEVAQLQKKVFLTFVYLPSFLSGIVVTYGILPENVLLTFFQDKNWIFGKSRQNSKISKKNTHLSLNIRKLYSKTAPFVLVGI